MVRIVGIQRSPDPYCEFVLLQNQGSLRLSLRGHALLREDALESKDVDGLLHIFTDEVIIPPGVYILLHTGRGVPRWSRSRDGALVYVAFMERADSVWWGYHGPVHVLAPQHTYTERREALVAV